jgi:hypothetical protein
MTCTNQSKKLVQVICDNQIMKPGSYQPKPQVINSSALF